MQSHIVALSAPQIGLREVNDLVTATAHDRLHHVEGEPLGHFEGDRGRHGELSPVDDGIDKNGAVVRECSGDSVVNLARVFDPNAANPDGFGHCRKIRIVELGPVLQEAGRLLLELDEAERPVVEDDDLHRQLAAASG